MNILEASAFELAAAIKGRVVTSRELVEAHIARIEAVNPAINALVAQRFEQALDEARLADEHVMRAGRKESLPPLWGVPCTIKELFAVAGMPNSAGIKARRDLRCVADAEAVRRLRDAGAIVMGVTNVPEAGMWMETYNHVYGRTNNPWDLRRTAGGSSGGEAALVACGASPFGLASDMGGSIRIPASFCGVVGHKPTGRLVPNEGCWPGVEGDLNAFLCSGPITRRVDDVMPLLNILTGPNALPIPTPDVDLRNVVLYPFTGSRGLFTWPAAHRSVADAVAALTAAGAKVSDKPLPKIRQAFGIWAAMLSSVPDASYRRGLSEGQALRLYREVALLPFRRSRFTSVAITMAVLEPLLGWFPKQVQRLVDAGRTLAQELEDALGPNGVLIHPPYTRPAPIHRAAMLTPFDFAISGIFNVLEFPATAVPIGFTADGLPKGIQVVARRHNDHLTLACAKALEQAYGGWQKATPGQRYQPIAKPFAPPALPGRVA